MRTTKFAVIGEVDFGKSTLMGRLLMETGAVSESKLEEVRTYSEAKTGSLEPAFLLDAFEFERVNELTLDYTLADFDFRGTRYRGVDTPGHREFLHKMMSGAFEVDWFLLVVDVTRPLSRESLRHSLLLKRLGIERGIVCLNKVDQLPKGVDVAELEAQLQSALEQQQILIEQFIPVSAKFGVGIAQLLEAMQTLAEGNSPLKEDPVQVVQGLGEMGQVFCWPIKDYLGSWVFQKNGLCAPLASSHLERGDYISKSPMKCSDRLRIELFAWRDQKDPLVRVQFQNAESSGVLTLTKTGEAELRLDNEVWHLPFRESKIAGSLLLKDTKGPFGAGVVL